MDANGDAKTGADNAATPAEEATNGGTPAGGAAAEPEFPDEDFEEGYEEEAYDEEMYGDEEGYGENGGAEFEINATDTDAQDFGEGLEGGEEDMLEDVRTKIREMEEEADKLRQLQSDSEKSSRPSLGSVGASQDPNAPAEADKLEVDARSVYVGQVDYSCTIEELDAHFRSCGAINRITIMCDRFSGHPKGFAYIEFAGKESVDQAVLMNDTTLKERQLKVIPKRTNQPGMGFGARRARRPYRGAGFARGRRPYRGYAPYYRSRSSYRGPYRGPYRPRRASRYIAY